MPLPDDPDLAVIGGGHHGLVLAAAAAAAGWRVTVLEAADVAGGAIRSDALTEPGVVHDTYSSVYPLALASPALAGLHLDDCGLVWRNAPLHNVHLAQGDRAAVLAPRTDDTADALEALSPGEGAAWRSYLALADRIGPALTATALGPIGDPTSAARLAWAARRDDAWALARHALSSVRTLGEDRFVDEPARAMLCGLALHMDLTPESAGTGIAATLLAWAAQQYGWPVPEGGAGRLGQALRVRAERAGATVQCATRVSRIIVRRNRAVAVRCADGSELGVRRAVVSSATAPVTFGHLLADDDMPATVRRRLTRWRSGGATFKLDWLLDAAVPWESHAARLAMTVHLGETVDDMSRYANECLRGLLPADPYLLIGQPTVADPTRAPAGRHTLWAYTHVPRHPRGDAAGVLRPGADGTIAWSAAAAAFADRLEARIERYAPGFRTHIVARHVMTPEQFGPTTPGGDISRNVAGGDINRNVAGGDINRNVAGGDISAGSMALTQQLVFRPLPGMFRYRTPIRGLYLCGATAHPGGGVHGAAGANAWRAIHADARLRRI